MSRNLFFRISWFFSMVILSSSLWSADINNDDDEPLLDVQIHNNETVLMLRHVITEYEKTYVKAVSLSQSTRELIPWLLRLSAILVVTSMPIAIMKCPKYISGYDSDMTYPSLPDDNYQELNMTVSDAFSLVGNICPLSLAGASLPVVIGLYPFLAGIYVKMQNYYADYKNYPQETWLNNFIFTRDPGGEITEDDMRHLGPVLSGFPDLTKLVDLKQAMMLAQINPEALKKLSTDSFINTDVPKYLTLLGELQQEKSSDLIEKLRGLTESFIKAPSFWQALVRTIPQNTLYLETKNNESAASVLENALYQILPHKLHEDIPNIFLRIFNKEASINKILAES